MRNPRINPASGDVLTIEMRVWRVDTVNSKMIRVVREGVGSWVHINYFRAFFKSASTLKLGEQK